MSMLHSRRALFALALTAALVVGLLSLVFAQSNPPAPPAKPPAPKRETATFAAGCFWSMEAIFKQLKGVDKVVPGYAGGSVAHPSYEEVETGTTGHAESINITFNPQVITYKDLLDVLLTVRDPTTRDRQGNDEGPQYRSIIFYRNEEQHKAATEMIKQFTDRHVYADPIVTEVKPFTNFYRAEDYHLDYYHKHPDQPYCANVIAPEIEYFRAKFKSKLKQ